MISRRRGVTLPEAIMTVAVLGLISYTFSKTNGLLNRLNRSSVNNQMMSYDAIAILTNISVGLKKCGDGLRGLPDPSTGQTVIALPDNPLANSMPELIFLYKDQAPVGSLGSEDLWKRYSKDVVNGRDGLLIRTYKTNNWLDIKTGLVPPTLTEFIKADEGVKIHQLAFTLLDSQDPPRIANQDPSTSSAICISLQLRKSDVHFEQEKTVVLENLLYGPN